MNTYTVYYVEEHGTFSQFEDVEAYDRVGALDAFLALEIPHAYVAMIIKDGSEY